MSRRKLYILLTRFSGNTARLIRFCTGFSYTHVSIGLDEDRNTFYSFIVRGFIVEKVTRYVQRREPSFCKLYELEVSEEVYHRIKAIVASFAKRKEALHYTRLGLLLCLLHIPFKWENHYICSQFVAEVLLHGRAAPLVKGSELYLPKDFGKLPGMRERFQGTLQGLLEQFCMPPEPA